MRPTITTAAAGVITLLALGSSSAAMPSAHPAAQAASMPPARSEPPVQTLPRPDDFVGAVTHPYFSLEPGTRWWYRSVTEEGVERIRVTVLAETRLIEGITATVVHDRATLDGSLVEDTFDWYAQDRLGNVWYLGEDTTAYESGKPVGKEGSWEAGVDGARAGLALPGSPTPMAPYRQEFRAGEAEDVGVVLDTSSRVHVRAGTFRRVWMTKDTTRLEPEQIELKFYAPGVGQVLELGVSPAQEQLQLVRVDRP